MIKPTIGRVVWYWVAKPSPQQQPLAAIVANVIDDGHVNLSVFDAEGNQRGETNVPLVQEEGVEVVGSHYCEWMPYQKAVAAGVIPAVKHAI